MSTEASTFTAEHAVEVYTKGIKAWFPDKEEGWVSTTCISNKTIDDTVTITFEEDNNGKVYQIHEDTLGSFFFLTLPYTLGTCI
jgi:myosin heavy subunit